MVEDALLSEYFQLSSKRKDEVMREVCNQFRKTYEHLVDVFGTEHANEIVKETLNKEKRKGLTEENYEYCEIIKIIENTMKDALS
jgi:hypothetical protein